ncbi:yod1 deubiquitinase [Brevipalpus obovatus]|uniref:yod1 deubiquitinase n=1 Tax=Brevipalpus obovatus TaxID=246614 RepID=UPI003D9EC2E0
MADQSTKFILRCRTKKGQHTLDMLTGESTVDDLMLILSGIAQIDGISQLRVKEGFPPQPIDLNSGSTRLIELFPTRKAILLLEDANLQVQTPQSTPTSSTFTNTHPTSTSTINASNISKSTGSSEAYQNGIGELVRREVPANNSCLFNAVHFCISGGKYDEKAGFELRRVIAEAVRKDPTTYNEAILGRANSDYYNWILNHDNWGGAIELSILSEHYSVEIVAVDTQTVRFNRFGEDKNYKQRILLIYDGIHYDPLMLQLIPNDPTAIQTNFSTNDEHILSMALGIARKANQARQFVDVQNFTLKCLTCQKGLRGQEEARDHYKQTKHFNFVQY